MKFVFRPKTLDLLRKADFVKVIGRENFCGTFDEALDWSKELLGQ